MKRDLFGYLDKVCELEVVLATNTSGLRLSMIASGTLNPQRIVATHFWNPAHLIPLVEVVRGEKTSDQTVKRAFDLLKYMKKKPIEVKKEAPGFVGNRLQFERRYRCGSDLWNRTKASGNRTACFCRHGRA